MSERRGWERRRRKGKVQAGWGGDGSGREVSSGEHADGEAPCAKRGFRPIRFGVSREGAGRARQPGRARRVSEGISEAEHKRDVKRKTCGDGDGMDLRMGRWDVVYSVWVERQGERNRAQGLAGGFGSDEAAGRAAIGRKEKQ
eukprot:121927-Pleurochrysis_carterae.AAC.3